MKKFSIIFIVSVTFLTNICHAGQTQSDGNNIFNTIDNVSPIPVDELILTPVLVPVGLLYGASMITFSAVGAVIAAPIAVPMMIADKKKESSEKAQYYGTSPYYQTPQYYNAPQYYNNYRPY